MPSRMLRDYTDSLRFDGISAESERLFIRLVMRADDYGRFHADPRLIKAACFPLAENLRTNDLSRWIDDLIHRQLILRYDVGGRKYLALVNYGQRLKLSKAKFPAMPGKPDDWLPVFNEFPEVPGSSRKFPPEVEGKGSRSEVESEVENEPEGVETPSGGLSALVDAVWENTPKLGRERSSRTKVEKSLTRIQSKERPSAEVLRDALTRWAASESWLKDGGAFVPGIHRWVQDRQWENVPMPAGPKQHHHRGIVENIEF